MAKGLTPEEFFNPAPAQSKGLTPEEFFGAQLAMPQEQPLTGNVQSKGYARAQGFASTIPFGERAIAGLGSLIAAPFVDESISDLYNQARADQVVTQEARPAQYYTGMGLGIAATLPALSARSIGGGAAATEGIRGGINAIPTATQKIGDFVGRGSTVASRALRGAAVSAPTGALYGYGAAPEGERVSGAVEGAGFGAVGGAALPVAGYALNKTVVPALGKLSNYISTRGATQAGQIVPAKLDPAMKKVYARLVEDLGGEDQLKQALASYQSTQGKSLIEVGGARTTNLAKGAAQFPSGEAKAAEFFDKAIGVAPDKLKTALSTVSKSQNYYDDLDELVKVGREKARPFYEFAYKKNQNVSSPVIDKILRTPEGKSALSEAVKNVQNEMALVAKPTPELTTMAKELQDLGLMDATQGGVASGLKLKTLDQVKRAMDSTINKAFKAGDDAEAGRIINLKNTLLREIDAADKSGSYAKARKVSGDYLSSKKAMEEGLSFFTDNKELAIKKFRALSKPEQNAYRIGVARKIRDKIESSADGANVARIFKNETNRLKLESILSPKEYSSLLKKAQEVDKLYQTRNQVIGGSPTTSKQVAAQEFMPEGVEFAADLVRGRGLIGSSLNAAGKWVGKQVSGLSDQSAKEVAEILFEQDPKKKFQIVQQLTRQAEQSPSNLKRLDAARKLQAIQSLDDKAAEVIRYEPTVFAYPRNPEYNLKNTKK